jgi:hypothetical protein
LIRNLRTHFENVVEAECTKALQQLNASRFAPSDIGGGSSSNNSSSKPSTVNETAVVRSPPTPSASLASQRLKLMATDLNLIRSSTLQIASARDRLLHMLRNRDRAHVDLTAVLRNTEPDTRELLTAVESAVQRMRATHTKLQQQSQSSITDALLQEANTLFAMLQNLQTRFTEMWKELESVRVKG